MSKSEKPGNVMRLKLAGGWADPSDVNDPMDEIAARYGEHDHELAGVCDEDLVDDRRLKTLDGSGGWLTVRGSVSPGHTSEPGSSIRFADGPDGDPHFIEAPRLNLWVTSDGGSDPLIVAVKAGGAASTGYVVYVDDGSVGTTTPSDCVVHWVAMGRVSGG